jgi:hypothetical protein
VAAAIDRDRHQLQPRLARAVDQPADPTFDRP